MKNAAKLLTVLLGAALVLTMVGCPKKIVKVEEPVPPPPPPDTTPEIVEMPKLGTLATVYFDFDKSDIRAGDAEKLKGNAAEMKKVTDKLPMVVIEGYCDPVGTSEYNMALGQRRADAAKAYLVQLGISADKLSTISYGEEKLVTQDEKQYELNRRAEFKPEQ